LKFQRIFAILQIELLRLFLQILLQKVLGGLSLSFSPLVKDWLEQALEELSHASECSSPVEEVKLFVVLFILLS
jgi:hypothetical protein